ncbi:MAG: hypothetical protein M3033_09480 [Acidobacteriota bacterium]|nr:hypothetical protein [Acidobacteriota bacterium]
MYKFSIRFSIVILTFFIGIFAAAHWFYNQEAQQVQIILLVSSGDSIYFKEINQATNLGGLTQLRKTYLGKDDIEVRVWRGFGLSPLEGVILKRTNGEWLALHIKTDHYAEPKQAEVKQLSPPKSGWESFWKQLVDKEILTLRQSSENECDIPGNDEMGYVIEINQDKTYRNYSYPVSGKCREAKQTKDIGEFIGLEFDSGREECKTTEWFACTTLRKAHETAN